MNPHELKRRFPNAGKSFIKLNSDNPTNTGSTSKPEQLVRKQMEASDDKTAFTKRFKLVHVGVVFHAEHGIKLDEDNRRYTVKPLLDSIVSMGLAQSDREIKTDVLQRMDKDNPNL